MRSTRLLPVFAGAAVLAGGMAVLAPAAAQASVACSQSALVAAINLANTSGGGNVTLTPGCTYILTRSHGGGTHGPDGLPIITTVITLTGNANVITRSAGLLTASFRIAEVSATGNLTLKSVTLSNGSSTGDGGGILNFGAVTLTSSALTGNTTLLGNGGGIASGPAAGAAATFTSSTLSGNTALTGSGGGIATIEAVLTITSSPVSSNAASLAGGKGGGIYRQGTPAVTVTTSPISGNMPNNCAGSVPAVPNCTG
jgi:hypothetical protein